jgi:hypothetical protein
VFGFREQVEDEAVFGLEAAPLGVAKPPLGDLEGREVGKSLAHGFQAFVQIRREGAKRQTVLRLRPDGREGVGEQRRTFPVAGSHAPGGNERKRLAFAQRVALERA